MAYKYLFQPIKINNLALRNRLVMTAHVPRINIHRYLRYLEERAKGGVGLICISDPAVYAIKSLSPAPPARFLASYAGDPDVVAPDPLTPDGVAYFDRVLLPIFRQQAEVIHRHGAACFSQLISSGSYQTQPNWQPSWTASPVPDAFRCEVPHEMDLEEIKNLVTVFGHMARRVKDGGMDGIEIHAVHGLLLNEFISPFSNHRTDAYGGSVEKRLRIVFEIIAEIRRQVGRGFPVGMRIPVDEFVEGGLSIKDMRQIAPMLEPELDYFCISGATESGLKGGVTIPTTPPWYVAPGIYAPLAGAIKEVTHVPVVATCRINDPALAEKILADGQADMIGMARALIADPEFPNKAREGREDDIRRCIACNEGCRQRTLRRWFMGLPIACTVNAAAGREEQMEIIRAAAPRKVLVVGGGPAGMEAARVAALRGHKVVLCEKSPELGGQVLIFTKDPRREEFAESVRYLSRQVARLPIEVRLNTEVTTDIVRGMAPDTVIVATGSFPAVPPVPGIQSSRVLTSWQVLRQEKEVGHKVIVVGGKDEHQAAPSLGEYLRDRGHDVEVICENMQIGQAIEWGTMHLLMKRLLEKGVRLSTLTALKAIDGKTVTVLNVFTRRESTIEGVDTVVLAMGNEADNSLYRALKGEVKELYQAGDCIAPRHVLHAIMEGSRAGRCV